MDRIEIKRIDAAESHLVAELFNKYRVFYEQPSDMELAKTFIATRLGNNESVIFVALHGAEKTPAAFTQLYPIYSSVRAVKNWLLNDLYVDAPFRQKGIGEDLLRTAMSFAAVEGAQYVELETNAANTLAQRLYEQTGFKRVLPDAGFYTYRITVANL